MKTLILLLFPLMTFAQLPGSGSLSIKTAAGGGNSIAQEVDGNTTGDKSLSTLSVSAGKLSPHSMLEFYSYDGFPQDPENPIAVDAGPGISVGWDQPSAGGYPTNYRIERDVNGGGYSFLADESGFSYNDNTATTVGATYTYRIRSENARGESSYVVTNSIVKS